MKKAQIQQLANLIKAEDLNGKVLVFTDNTQFDMQTIQGIQEALVDSGLAGMVVLPKGAKYDVITKEKLKEMVESL